MFAIMACSSSKLALSLELKKVILTRSTIFAVAAKSSHPGGKSVKRLNRILRILKFTSPEPEVFTSHAYGGKVTPLPVAVGVGVTKIMRGVVYFVATFSAPGRSERRIPHEK